MATGAPRPQFDFRGPDGWQRNLLIGLFVLYVLELVIARAYPQLQIHQLLGWGVWSGWSIADTPWQPLTRFLVQGASVFSVVISLLVLYLVLPTMNDLLGQRSLGQAFFAGAIGATVVPFLADVSGLPLSDSFVFGWQALVTVPFVLLGILRPNATVYLIVFPIEARWILWGSLGIALLYIIGTRSVGSFEPLGVWLGTYLWYNQIGPGRARRAPEPEKPSVMKQRRQFHVIEGGRDDDVVH